MKKLFITALLLAATCNINSQQVYQNIFNFAQKTMNNPQSPSFLVDVCNFETMALRYMKNEGIKLNGSVEGEFLDNQAAAMTTFINGFFKEVQSKQASPKDQKKVIYRYIRISRNNPLYNDNDTETTECFSTDSTSITPFSLNTNWEKAVSALKVDNGD